MRRLGIMGGTFDPIHLGHLVCAEVARDACGLDEVLFVVAGSPHFKQGMTHAAPQERLAMVELAVEGDESFFVSDLEVIREGITYTAETLDELTRAHPDADLTFIIGADSLLTLRGWKDAERIAALARIACVLRPGYAVDQGLLDELAKMGFRITIVEGPSIGISSSQIRQRVQERRTIRYLVPDAVATYICEEGLYE